MLMVCISLGLAVASFAAPPSKHPQITRIEVDRPKVVVRGAYLDKVEIWAVPTGTGITPENYVLLGTAERKNAAGAEEIWLFPIPSCATETRLLATEVFAKAFGPNGTFIGNKSLPYVGASAVHDALCGVQ
jgi:hypothetical protein